MSGRRDPAEDLTGQVFSEWTVLGPAPPPDTGPRHRRMIVRCSCGTVRMVRRANLIYGSTRCCGACKSTVPAAEQP